MVRVNVCSNLEHESCELRFFWLHITLLSFYRTRTWCNLNKCVEEFLHTEVVQRRTEEHRAQLAGTHSVQIHFPSGGQKLHIVDQLLMLGFAVQQLGDLGIVQIHLLLFGLGLAVQAGEEQQLALFPVVNALEILAAADGPVHGIGFDAQFTLHFIQ